MILERGFDVNVRTERGTALHEAALCGKVEVVRSLVSRGVNASLRDGQDRTVLEAVGEDVLARTPAGREVERIIRTQGKGEEVLTAGNT